MNWDTYVTQMTRMMNQFGNNVYSKERRALIWEEVRYLSDSWMTKIVTRFIGEYKTAPLLPEFRTEASKEREKERYFDRLREEQEAKKFFESNSLPKDDEEMILSDIKKRIQGRMRDEDWEKFKEDLKKTRTS